jgi:hypothetical protein
LARVCVCVQTPWRPTIDNLTVTLGI